MYMSMAKSFVYVLWCGVRVKTETKKYIIFCGEWTSFGWIEWNEMKWTTFVCYLFCFVCSFFHRKTNHHFVSKLEMYWCNRVSREGFKTLSPFFICSFQLSFHICIMRTNSHQREINFGEKPGIFLFEISSYPFFVIIASFFNSLCWQIIMNSVLNQNRLNEWMRKAPQCVFH